MLRGTMVHHCVHGRTWKSSSKVHSVRFEERDLDTFSCVRCFQQASQAYQWAYHPTLHTAKDRITQHTQNTSFHQKFFTTRTIRVAARTFASRWPTRLRMPTILTSMVVSMANMTSSAKLARSACWHYQAGRPNRRPSRISSSLVGY